MNFHGSMWMWGRKSKEKKCGKGILSKLGECGGKIKERNSEVRDEEGKRN